MNYTMDAFEAGTIDPDKFDHEAHVHMGWQYVAACAPTDAVARFDTALRRLVRKLGAESKYHATITAFYLLLIQERAVPGQSWDAFRRANPDLFDHKALLARYYSNDRLMSDAARQSFVLPDRIAA